MTETTATQRGREQPDKNTIRPFPKLNVPEAELTRFESWAAHHFLRAFASSSVS